MKKLSLLVVSLLAVAAPASAETSYKPYSLFGTGYRDHEDHGRWKVWGNGRDYADGRALALYRTAELADAAGIAVLRVVDQGITITQRRSSGETLGEIAHFTILPVRSPADLTACEMRHAERCLTLSTAKIVASYGPRLGQRATPRTAGLAAAGAAYGTPGDQRMAGLAEAVARYYAAHPTSPTPAAVPQVTTAQPIDPYQAGRQAALAARRASGDSGER